MLSSGQLVNKAPENSTQLNESQLVNDIFSLGPTKRCVSNFLQVGLLPINERKKQQPLQQTEKPFQSKKNCFCPTRDSSLLTATVTAFCFYIVLKVFSR